MGETIDEQWDTGTTLEIQPEKPAASWSIEGDISCVPQERRIREGERLLVGADASADIRVFDRAVSARHCAALVEGGRLVIENLGSKNGVYVGGARIERAYLGSGASFAVGRVVFACRPWTPACEADTNAKVTLSGVVGSSLPMRRIALAAQRVASIRAPVLLCGETGTGKDVLARAIHAAGPRRSRPFVPLNVGTLPRELADTELFGHERGAYTGAHAAREGAFVEANGGTLFLDEIAELPPDLQVKLLRVLEDGEVRPVGGRVRRKVDVRIISATWAHLPRRVAEGTFRQDLYQRLAVFIIDLPPLRERRTDIPALAHRLLTELEPEIGTRELGTAALAKLASHGWPGNVRELRNVLYRAALATEGRIIGGREIAESIASAASGYNGRPEVSVEQARAAVDGHGGNVSAAARHLGMPRSTFRGLLQR